MFCNFTSIKFDPELIIQLFNLLNLSLVNIDISVNSYFVQYNIFLIIHLYFPLFSKLFFIYITIRWIFLNAICFNSCTQQSYTMLCHKNM